MVILLFLVLRDVLNDVTIQTNKERKISKKKTKERKVSFCFEQTPKIKDPATWCYSTG
jgi:hypothetical protein